ADSAMSSARELIAEGAALLRAAGVDAGTSSAEWLLAGLSGVRPGELYLDDQPVDEELAGQFRRQIQARASGTPLQHLLGYEEFCGLRFAVRPGVFIPRPETETVL